MRKYRLPIVVWATNLVLFVIGLSLLSPTYVEKCERAADGAKKNCTPQHIDMYLLDVLGTLLRDYALWNMLATIAIAAFTYSLMRSTKYMWIATKAASDAAKKSAIVAEHSLSKLQRAFVFPGQIEVVKVPNGFGFRMRWENQGATPALHVKQHFNWGLFEGPMHPQYPLADQGTPSDRLSYMAPKGHLRSGLLQITAAQMATVRNGPNTLYFWGWITYRDIFEDTPEHITRMCWQALQRGDDPQGNAGEMELSFMTHNRGNCVDEDCAEQNTRTG